MYENSEYELELLKQQLEWVKQQDHILVEIESRLYKMKKIAWYAAKHHLSSDEQEWSSKQIKILQVTRELSILIRLNSGNTIY